MDVDDIRALIMNSKNPERAAEIAILLALDLLRPPEAEPEIPSDTADNINKI